MSPRHGATGHPVHEQQRWSPADDAVGNPVAIDDDRTRFHQRPTRFVRVHDLPYFTRGYRIDDRHCIPKCIGEEAENGTQPAAACENRTD
jgi:hypothetical protein